MSRRMIFPVLVLGLSSLVGPIAHADTPSQARQQIQADYDSQNAAMGRKDPKGALAHVDPAFIGGGSPGSKPENYQLRAEAQAHMFEQTQSVQMTTHIQKFVLHGANADAQIADRATVSVANPKTGKVEKLTFVYTIADKWVKRSRGWMLLSSHQLSMKMLP